MAKIDLRRRSARRPLRLKAAVVFDHPQGKPVIHTLTEDLSAGGVAISSAHGDLTGALVTLLIAQPGRKGRTTPTVHKVRARVVSTVRAPGMSQYRHGLSFVHATGYELEALAELLNAPASVQPSAAARAVTQEETDAAIGEALAKAYRYLGEFARQQNQQRPAYPKGYAIAGVPDFSGLRWEEGHADYHDREISRGVRRYERVSLRFRLSGGKEVKVAREFPASEKLQQLLEDCGIRFSSRATWSKRGSLELTEFAFPCEVGASLQLLGQFDTGSLLLRTSNVCGFGSMEQMLAPEAVDETSLEELGNYILVKTTRLGPLLLREP